MVELVNSSDNLAYIIAKAKEFDVLVDPVDEDSSSNASDDGGIDILDDTADNPVRAELLAAIRSLNLDERQELLALVWLGRGDYEVVEWNDALEIARERYNSHEPQYLLGTPLLGDYLEEALTKLEFTIQPYADGD